MRTFKSADPKEIEALTKEIYNRQRQQQDMCDHKNGKGPTIQRYKDKGTITRNTSGWSDDAKRCTRCGAIFESTVYTPTQLQDSMRMQYSIIDQIKLLAELDESEQEQILQALESLRIIESVNSYYNEMIKRLGKDRNKDNRKRGARGGFGVSQNMFNQGGRQY